MNFEKCYQDLLHYHYVQGHLDDFEDIVVIAA